MDEPAAGGAGLGLRAAPWALQSLCCVSRGGAADGQGTKLSDGYPLVACCRRWAILCALVNISHVRAGEHARWQQTDGERSKTAASTRETSLDQASTCTTPLRRSSPPLATAAAAAAHCAAAGRLACCLQLRPELGQLLLQGLFFLSQHLLQ